jgi:hypothetical protein
MFQIHSHLYQNLTDTDIVCALVRAPVRYVKRYLVACFLHSQVQAVLHYSISQALLLHLLSAISYKQTVQVLLPASNGALRKVVKEVVL